jgi:hypothetical protein
MTQRSTAGRLRLDSGEQTPHGLMGRMWGWDSYTPQCPEARTLSSYQLGFSS